MENAKVSIIVLNWNGLEDTIECLESLRKVTYPNYETIIVDNGSEGNDADVLDDRYGEHTKLIRNEKNYGFVGGNNQAIRWSLENSSSDFFLLLNNDTVVDSEFLTELVKVVNIEESVGIAGPKTYYYDDPNRFWLTWLDVDMRKGRASHIGSREIDQGQYEIGRNVNHVAGSCFLIKRKVIEDIGLLDESYFSYWEEADYCIRTVKAGYKIAYVPKAKIWHKVPLNISRTSPIAEYYSARNNFLFMKKHATKKQVITFVLWFFSFHRRGFFIRTGLLLMYHRNLKNLKLFYKGIIDGLSILMTRDDAD